MSGGRDIDALIDDLLGDGADEAAPSSPAAAPDDPLARLAERLRADGFLDAAGHERARRVAAETGERLDRVLARLGGIGERVMAATLAAVLEVPLVRAADYPESPLCEGLLAPRFLHGALAVPLREGPGGLEVALADPLEKTTVAAIALAVGCPVRVCIGLAGEIETALNRLYGAEDGGAGLQALLDEAGGDLEADEERLRDLASEAPIVRLVNQIVTQAVDLRASDIHVEPFETHLRIRYRIDGELAEQEPLPRRTAAAVVSRFKLMAGLDIAEHRLPQDGRFKFALRGKEVDFRIATLPALHGENVTLRILDRSGVRLDFATLGMEPGMLAAFLGQLDRPNGIILVTGPTGSGKTTTLYTALSRLNQPGRKIITAEDPVEYQMHGINQIQVRPDIGLDFASVLRSTLRHDPDVVMIGEIRDLETAQIAVQAALTGHLVLSTTHTNGAFATVTRLVDLGVPDYLIASTLNAVLAQRLVRLLCPECRQPTALAPDLAAQSGLARLSGRDSPTVYRPRGCAACHGRGYHGRIGLYELLAVDEAVRRRIMALRTDAAPVRQGRSLFEDGLHKVLAGLTTLEEVWGVAAER